MLVAAAVAGALLVASIILIQRRTAEVALILLLGSPILLSPFQIGDITLDNLVSLVGMALAVIEAIRVGEIPLRRLSAYPLLIAFAILVSDLANGLSPLFPVTRFAGLALVPWLVTRTSVVRPIGRQLTVALVTLGALSVLVQPLTKFPDPYLQQAGDDTLRFGGLFGHPNFGTYSMALVALVIVAKSSLRWADWVLILLLGAALLMASSLTGIGVLIAVGLILIARRVGRVLIVIIAAVVLFATLGSTLTNRLNFFGTMQGLQENSAAWRFEQWADVLKYASGHEIFGIGYQQIEVVSPSGLGAHNAYIQTYVELGLVGLLFLALGLVVFIRYVGLRSTSFLLLLYVLVASMADPVLFYPENVAILLALTQAMDPGATNMAARIGLGSLSSFSKTTRKSAPFSPS